MGLFYLTCLFLGFCIGSFLNVCIYRIPRGESIAHPPSHCGACGTRLQPMDLIPVLSYLCLKRKCRYCGESISSQYAVIETVTGLLFVGLFWQYGLSMVFVETAMLTALLLVIAVIDYKTRWIPEKLMGFGAVVGLIFTFYHVFWLKEGFFTHVLGLLMGAGLFLILAVLTHAMRRSDIKLMGILGFWLGLKAAVLIIALSLLIRGITGLLLILLKIKEKKDTIPFGPFIALAAFLIIFLGVNILQQYFTFLTYLI